MPKCYGFAKENEWFRNHPGTTHSQIGAKRSENSYGYFKIANGKLHNSLFDKNKMGGEARKNNKRCFLVKKDYIEDIEELTAKEMKGPDIPY